MSVDNVVDFSAERLARGKAPIACTTPAEVFGPPRGKQIGDPVLLPDGTRGIVSSYRPKPGRAPTLFIETATGTQALSADAVTITI